MYIYIYNDSCVFHMDVVPYGIPDVVSGIPDVVSGIPDVVSGIPYEIHMSGCGTIWNRRPYGIPDVVYGIPYGDIDHIYLLYMCNDSCVFHMHVLYGIPYGHIDGEMYVVHIYSIWWGDIYGFIYMGFHMEI